MNLLKAIILGIVQGLTEFLPISSSGHLAVLQDFFGIDGEASFTFAIVLHLGSLVAVFVVFWKEIWALVKKPFQKMTLLIVIGTIPALVFGYLLNDPIESLFSKDKTWIISLCFIVTGIMLLLSDRMKDKGKKEADITYTDALVVGLFQCIGLPPGVSRSGSTITGALFRGLTRESATKFSFLLAIPIVLASSANEILHMLTADSSAAASAESIGALYMIVGAIAAALSGYLAIRFMLALIKKAKLKYFSFYVFVLAAVLLVKQFLF